MPWYWILYKNRYNITTICNLLVNEPGACISDWFLIFSKMKFLTRFRYSRFYFELSLTSFTKSWTLTYSVYFQILIFYSCIMKIVFRSKAYTIYFTPLCIIYAFWIFLRHSSSGVYLKIVLPLLIISLRQAEIEKSIVEKTGGRWKRKRERDQLVLYRSVRKEAKRSTYHRNYPPRNYE